MWVCACAVPQCGSGIDLVDELSSTVHVKLIVLPRDRP